MEEHDSDSDIAASTEADLLAVLVELDEDESAFTIVDDGAAFDDPEFLRQFCEELVEKKWLTRVVIDFADTAGHEAYVWRALGDAVASLPLVTHVTIG